MDKNSKKKRVGVMLVDDNDMMRSILRGMLRGEVYEVVGEARNGSVAVEMAQHLEPDIICLDIQMPEKDGLTALSEIKAAHPEIQVIMITGSADTDTVRAAISAGAVGFIVKPFNAARVYDALHHAVVRLKVRNSAKTVINDAPAEATASAPDKTP